MKIFFAKTKINRPPFISPPPYTDKKKEKKRILIKKNLTKTDVTSGPAPKNPSLNNCRASTYTSQTHLAKLLFRPERRKKRTTENQKKMKLCDAHCIKSQVSIVKILGANKNSNRCNFSCVEFSYFVDLIG